MATQIKSFGMTRMSIGSCSDFHHKVEQLITTATPAALHIEVQFEAYQKAVSQLASVVNRQRAFVATAHLKNKDKVRDNVGGVITNVVNDFLTTSVAKKLEAAQLLAPKLSPYRGIRSHEYTKQTAEVRGMLALLDEPENAAAIKTLGLAEEVEALREANAAFETAFTGKTAEVTDRQLQTDLDSKELMDEANNLYSGIVQVVNAYAIVQPDDTINTFIDSVNSLVGIFARIAGGKGSGGAAPDGGDGDGGNEGGSDTDVPGGV